ncbi:MAG TPA: ATP-binding protein [Terriglobales bacterium]|nr:ATP-binding protein [Terriglobales bacterium]
MRELLKDRPVLGYVFAAVASVLAIFVVRGIEPLVGYIPMLFLAGVAAVEAYAGAGPALLSVALCIGASLFVRNHPPVSEHLHNLTKLGMFPIVAIVLIYLMEAHRRQKRVVREQLLELNTLLESMPEAVFIFDSNSRLVDVNRAAEQICACTRAEIHGAHLSFLAKHMGLQQDEQPMALSDLAVTRALAGESVQNEARVFSSRADGSPMNALVSANPMRDAEGATIGALLVVRDVTEITQLQRQVADAERHTAIGQMASGIAHDFNNVLNTITQAAALLQSQPNQSDDQRFYVGMIENAARRGAEIIKRVREYVRGASGESAQVDVRQMLQDALDLTRPMWRGVNGLTVTTEFKPVPPVRANAADLRRVFTNLIVNAIQAMPRGGRLTARCEERSGMVIASVQDTGEGILPEQQKKIFLPYFTTKQTGTGLGLSTAQKILLASGGDISFTSEIGSGTTFTVQLPAFEKQPAKAA